MSSTRSKESSVYESTGSIGGRAEDKYRGSGPGAAGSAAPGVRVEVNDPRQPVTRAECELENSRGLVHLGFGPRQLIVVNVWVVLLLGIGLRFSFFVALDDPLLGTGHPGLDTRPLLHERG
jgi:hypothetical protein